MLKKHYTQKNKRLSNINPTKTWYMCISQARTVFFGLMELTITFKEKFEDTKWVIRSRKLKDIHHNVGKKRKKTKDKQRSKKIKLNLLFIILIGCITTSDICNINRFWLLSLGSLIFLLSKTLNYLTFDYDRKW